MHNHLVKLVFINCAIILPLLAADDNLNIKAPIPSIAYRVLTDIGTRPHMEDHHVEYFKSIDGTDYSFFGVYDGHGGEYAAKTAAYGDQEKNIPALHEILFSQLKEKAVINEHLFTKVFQTLDHHLLEHAHQISLKQPKRLPYNSITTSYAFVGTTALVALIAKTRLLLAWAGDSRAVVIGHDGQILYSTQDHKPERFDERERVLKAGGYIKYTPWCNRLDGILSMTRALGNYSLKTKGTEALIATPEVHELPLKNIAYIILASDGLWERASNEWVASIVRIKSKKKKYSNPLERIAQTLKNGAFRPGATDNITITIADLRDLSYALQNEDHDQQDLPMRNPLM